MIMKKANISRTICGILALSFILTSASCSTFKKKTTDPSKKSSGTASAMSDEPKDIYAAAEFGTLPECNYLDSLKRINGTDNLLVDVSFDDSDKPDELYISDIDLSSYTKVDVFKDLPKNSQSYFNSAVSPDGTIFVLTSVTDYGDFERPDFDDETFDSENFNYDAMMEAAKTTSSIITYDSSGNELSRCDLKNSDFSSNDGEAPYFANIIPYSSDEAIVVLSADNDEYYAVNTEGKIVKKLDIEFNSINETSFNKDGDLSFVSYNEDGMVINSFDKEKHELSNKSISIPEDLRNTSCNLRPSSDDYEFYLITSNDIYGLNKDGSCTKILNWLDTGIVGSYIRDVIPIGNEEFISYGYMDSFGTPTFYRITKQDPSTVIEKKIINLAVIENSNVTKIANDFNKSNNDYRIRIVDYSKYYEWDDDNNQLNSPVKQLKMDVVAGKSPDMIYFSEFELLKNLANKGTFVDLRDYLGKNGTLSEDELMPPLVKACETNGKLYCLAEGIDMTTFGIKKKFYDKDNWTMNDLKDVFSKMPKGTSIFQYNNKPDELFDSFSCGMSFVDYDKAECHFDSDEFIELLKFCKDVGSDVGSLSDNLSDEDWEALARERDSALRNDKALLESVNLSNPRFINSMKYGHFGEDVVLVGYPSNNGCGCNISLNNSFAIFDSSEAKDICWEFISTYLKSEDSTYYCIPALKEKYEKSLDEAMEDPYWIDKNNKKVTYKDTVYINDEEKEIPNLSKADRDMIYNYVMNADTSSTNFFNDDVDKIVDEETNAYFAGERSAEDTAEMIQNRVSIMLSEQS